MAYYKSGQIYATQNSNVAIQTASGGIANFETPLQMPIFGLKANIVPIQVGSGTPSPSNPRALSGRTQVSVTRTGKNLLGGSKLLANAQVHLPNGTTDTENKTFTYSATTAIANNTTFSQGMTFKEGTRYTFIFTFLSTAAKSNMRIYYKDGTYSAISNPSTSNVKETIVYTSNRDKTIDYLIKYAGSGSTTVYYDESGIFEGIVTAEEFEAYKGETKTISLGQTVSGGTFNLLTGEASSDVVIVNYDGTEDWQTNGSNGVWLDVKSGEYLEAVYGNIFEPLSNGSSGGLKNNQMRLNSAASNLLIKCPDAMTAEDFKTFLQSNPLQVAYRVAATDISLTPETFKTLVGTNNFYADCGDVEVKYKNIITGG